VRRFQKLQGFGGVAVGAVVAVAIGAGVIALVTTTVRLDDNDTRSDPLSSVRGSIEVAHPVSGLCDDEALVWSETTLEGFSGRVNLQDALDTGAAITAQGRSTTFCIRNLSDQPVGISYQTRNEVSREDGLCSTFEEIAGDTSCPATPDQTASGGELDDVAGMELRTLGGCSMTDDPVLQFGTNEIVASADQIGPRESCRIAIYLTVDPARVPTTERLVQADTDLIRFDLDITSTP
jgi:hypothetical protein